MEALISETDNLNVGGNGNDPNPPMGLTENLSLTYLSSGNPCLDFFFHIVPDTPSTELIQRLSLAWTHDPLVTLKLVFNLRGVRGTGKSDKEGFYAAALWLHLHHPKTLALNVRALADFGYLKDLPEILYRLHEGPDVREIAKQEWRIRKRGVKGSRRWRARKFKRLGKKKSELSEEEKKELFKTAEKLGNVVDKESARRLRKEKDTNRANRASERYKNDPHYRLLYDCVCNVFAEILKSDLQNLSSGHANKVSLAAKWCPSIDSSYDKVALICQGIATRVFPRDSDPEYEGLDEARYVSMARDRLRKQVLVPLRSALELPEVYMSARKWESLPYNRVASVAMKTYKKLFLKHDNGRFNEYLENVKSGKAKIAAGALLPHEIIGSLNDEDGGKVAELQWDRMVEDLSKKGKLTNCIAVCDVSGSMWGIPMEVSVALGLLVSELSVEPWKGKVITFSADPELHLIEGETLSSKTGFIRSMDCGLNTDFQKVFDRILEVAVEGNLSEDQMIRRVFVFSDMEFDEANGISYRQMMPETVSWFSRVRWDEDLDEIEEEELEGIKKEEQKENMKEEDEEKTENEEEKENGEEEEEKEKEEDDENESEEKTDKVEEEEGEFDHKKAWETDYEVIQRKYKEKGYSKVPEIVFWNLRNSSSTPVAAKQSGVALVSGFSKNLLTLFLEEGGIVNPEDVMGLAIAGEEYKKLVVYD